MFDKLEQIILTQPQAYNDEKNLIRHSGKNRTKHGIIKVQYKYNTKNGGFNITDDMLGNYASALTKHETLNEKEERIRTDKQYISISGCIEGIIIPKEVDEEFESELFKTLKIADMWLVELDL